MKMRSISGSLIAVVVLVFIGGCTTPKGGDPVKKDATPAKKDATPAKKDATPAKKDATPVKKDATPAKKDASTQPAVSPAEKNAKKRVLILGDSTSMRYTPVLRRIYPEVDIVRPGGNHMGTITALKHLDRWLGKGKWDVIHFNFGLHDFKHMNPKTGRPSNKREHPFRAAPEQYRKNLEKIVKRLKETGAILIFATTTPVPKDEHYRVIDNRMSPVYNKIALKIMKEHDVVINDLYNYTLPNLAKWQQKKDVHFHGLGTRKIAEKIKESIKATLALKS